MTVESSGRKEHCHRILLVEDQSIIALATATLLREVGYTVDLSYRGETAVQAVQDAEAVDAPFDLVLMDIDLGPGIDGVEAARRILAERQLPIVFLTGHSEDEVVDRVRSVTRYGYVLKSSGQLILKLAIEMALDLFQAHRDTLEREQELEAIYRHAPVLMFVVDSRDRVVKTNQDGLVPDSIGAAVDCIYAAGNPEGCGRSLECRRCELRRLVEETFADGTEHTDVAIEFPVSMRISTAPLDQGAYRAALVTVLELVGDCVACGDKGRHGA